MKRITAIILALLMCVLAVGCSKNGEEIPEGMQLSSLDGEPFKLYVPEGSWTVNMQSGISGAYHAGIDNVYVSARYYTPSDAEMTLDAYVASVTEDYSKALELFDLKSNAPAVLGGRDAKELIYTAKHDSTDYTFRQLTTKHKGDFIVLTFYCPTEVYEDRKADFDSIVEVFALCDKSDVNAEVVTDKKTPTGMKIASADNLEYRLYVPMSWVCDADSGKSEAYYSESGKPHVSVTSYSPDGEITAAEYFAECEKEYKKSLSGYELLSSVERQVAGKSAISYTYRVKYGEMQVKLMQTVFVYSGLVYSFTYTALEDSFDVHMDDVTAMLDSFIFR